MGMARIEATLAQQLTYIEQEALFQTFIDLKKAYDSMDCERFLEIMKGYGVGLIMLRLIETFWNFTILVYWVIMYYDKTFKAYHGVMQEGTFLPYIFNVMVYAIMREWLRQVLGPDAAHNGYGEEIRPLWSYSMHTMLCWHPEMQSHFNRHWMLLLDYLNVWAFCTNMTKTKVMICVTGRTQTRYKKLGIQ